jgi:hypothetical protein
MGSSERVSLVVAGGREQRVDRSLLLFAGCDDVLAGCPPGSRFRVRVGECDLDEGALQCDRLAQLVRRRKRRIGFAPCPASAAARRTPVID